MTCIPIFKVNKNTFLVSLGLLEPLKWSWNYFGNSWKMFRLHWWQSCRRSCRYSTALPHVWNTRLVHLDKPQTVIFHLE